MHGWAEQDLIMFVQRTSSLIRGRSQNSAQSSVLSCMPVESSVDDAIIPKNYKQAMNSSNRDDWIAAMEKEKQSIVQNGVFELVKRPVDVGVIKPKWVYAMKGQSRCSIEP